MAISVGERLPDATLLKRSAEGFEEVELGGLLAGRTVVLFALPGAYTGTCSTTHLPSFIRTADAFRAKGVHEIACLAVNDPFVLSAWSDASGATEAGITMLADPEAAFTKAVGMAFTAPPVGLYDRSNRYAIVVEDGVVTHAMIDEPGVCEISRGEELLEALG